MKAFLTGGTGFIGSHLIDLLLARDVEVYALVRNAEKEPALLEKKVRVLRGDLFSIPALPSGLDFVFHLAGKTRSLKSADYYTVNRDGTASLYRSLLNLKEQPKVVILSSQAAAGPSDGREPVRESDRPRPITHYGKSKLQGEREALRFKDRFPLAIARASAVFGPQDRDFLPFFKMATKGILLSFQERKEASVIYVKDLVEALFRCARTNLPSGEILNIANAGSCTWEDLGRAAAAALGKKCRRIKVPGSLAYLYSLACEAGYHLTGKPGIFNRDKYRDLIQPNWIMDVGKAVEILSFEPRFTLEQALEETMAWYIDQKWL
ncbi:MAG: NAD(P)-dependent oxidoreductase [Candidatus Aminicenantales bacterium]